MSRKVLPLLLTLAVCLPASAATHTWIGAASNRMSDAANWSGGSPVGDPDAQLRFPAQEASRKDVINDVPRLRFTTLTLDDLGYSISGEALAASDATIDGQTGVIACDIVIDGTLTLFSRGFPLDLAGSLSGSGSVHVQYGEVRFSGQHANTYTGETLVNAQLSLQKTSAIAVPGTLRTVPGDSSASVFVAAPEQIADDADVFVSSVYGSLGLGANETVRTLHLSSSRVGSALVPPTLTVQSLDLSGDSTIETNLRLTQDTLQVPQSSSLTVKKNVLLPPGGVTLRGAGSVSWTSDSTATIRIDGVAAAIDAPAARIELTSGSYSGKALSIAATGGTIGPLTTSSSDIRLGPQVTVALTLASVSIVLNGTLDLADASLSVVPTPNSAVQPPVTVIRNSSAQAVIGTFHGLPEGSVVANRWRISYHGGDGNDVTLTELAKPAVTLTLAQSPSPAITGQQVVLTATVSGSAATPPTGTVTFTLNGQFLGTATLSGNTATLSIDAPLPGTGAVLAHYNGDDVYASSGETRLSLYSSYPKPVITSTDPATIPNGAPVPVTIRGSNFFPGSGVLVSSTAAVGSIEVVSSTEIHARIYLLLASISTVRLAVTSPDRLVTSDVVTLPVFEEPTNPDPASPIQYEASTVVGRVTRHANTAWMSSDSTFNTRWLTDDDGDGVVRWEWTGTLGARTFALVDLSAGTFAIRGHGEAVPDVHPFPRSALFRDANGVVSRIVLPVPPGETPGSDQWKSWTIQWARPGVGAWHAVVEDGLDDDKTLNGLLDVSVRAFAPMGSSPATPAGILAGDILIALPSSPPVTPLTVFASRLGSDVNSAAPGGIVEVLARRQGALENAGVVHLPVIRYGGDAPLTVRYRIFDGPHDGAARHVAAEGTLSFAQGETLKTIDIPLLDNATYDGKETFDVVLSESDGVTLGRDTIFVVSIFDDEKLPVVQLVGPSTRQVVDSATPTPMRIDLTIAANTTTPIRLTWSISTTRQSGSVTFEPGQHTQSMTVLLPPHFSGGTVDFRYMDNTLATGVGLTHVFSSANRRADTADVVVSESGGVAHVVVSMTPSPTSAIFLSYRTVDGTAKAGSDYTSTTGTLQFAAGQASATIDVPILNDAVEEGDETFTVALSDNFGSLFSNPNVTVVIADDELTAVRPRITIVGTATPEGSTAAFEVRLSQPTTVPVSVRYVTADGTATAGTDYEALDFVLTFAPGETTKTIAIPTFADLVDENDETFTVTLSTPVNATIDTARARATIVNVHSTPPPRRRSLH